MRKTKSYWPPQGVLWADRNHLGGSGAAWKGAPEANVSRVRVSARVRMRGSQVVLCAVSLQGPNLSVGLRLVSWATCEGAEPLLVTQVCIKA